MGGPVKDPVKDPARDPGKDADGRAARWDDHREARRAVLVEAAVAAIDELGPGAGVADIARSAGVSKPVLYRYFTDKSDLHAAVGHWGATQVVDRLMPVLLSDLPLREKVYRGCDEYLGLIAEHPHVFLLLVEHRAAGDPLADGKQLVAAGFARLLGDTLRNLGIDASGAEPWAQGLVGLGLATGEWWLRRNTMSRAAVADHLGSFVWHALAGIAAEHGVQIEDDDRVRASVSVLPKTGGPAR
ncbi:MAG TPA: TetR/AcrR family transcriptional regulator [Nocardioidaceae bacterium]|nr:TetR/AcrR family transcriptional regulator [Nocardioidaceae bacterium]